jgi:hypothetical protein
MVLECYFDGANKPTQEYGWVVLAMACGTPEQWKGFNADWNDLLEHYPAPPLHTKQAVSLKGEFSPENGWDRDRVDDFIISAVKVIRKHMGILSPELGLHVTTLTIMLDDYRRARDVVPLLPNSVNEILTSETLGFCFRWGRSIGAEHFHLHFDQGEPFRGHALDRANSEQAKIDAPYLAKMIVLPAADSKLTPALQMADLFAWCISHNDNVNRWWDRVLNDLPRDSKYLDYGYLVNPTPGALERTTDSNLPRRGKAPADLDPVAK